MIFTGKISKGHNSVKIVYGIRVLVFCTSPDDVDGVRVLFSCTSSDGGLHLYKVS